MKQSELKKMIKEMVRECLVEVLNEGLQSRNLVTATQQRKPVQEQTMTSGRRIAESMRVGSNPSTPRRAPTPPIQEAVRSLANNDPIMASIFADTAATTLQEQASAASPGGIVANDAASFAVAQSTPEAIFGSEAEERWNMLAFMDSPRRKAL